MAFWGVEVKAGKPFTLSPDKSCGRLRISQATLGIGTSNNKSLVQCNVGKKTPVMLCCLLPDKAESCHLELEFEESEEVTFSVVGPRSVYLTGYFLGNPRRILPGDDESESYGEDVGVTDSEDLNDDDDDYEQDSFIDDSDPQVFSPSPSSSFETNKTKAGTKKKSRKRLKKKYDLSGSEDDGAISSTNAKMPVVEIDEEDQMPISSVCGTARPGDEDPKRKKHILYGNTSDDHQSGDEKIKKKKKKKKKRKNNKENEASIETANTFSVAKNGSYFVAENVGGKRGRARTLSSGLIVEELKAGEKDGEVASSGNKVTVHYTGTLKEGGQIFDSTAGKDPLKFRLGKGRVMDGLDQGIEGMRVGGKRRLQIPPALGYGSEGSSRVPPSSWLLMDVELLRVR